MNHTVYTSCLSHALSVLLGSCLPSIHAYLFIFPERDGRKRFRAEEILGILGPRVYTNESS